MIRRNRALIANGVTPALLKGCIAEHQKTLGRLGRLDGLYRGKHDILGRKPPGEKAPNNRIVANFPKYIVDTAVGYMFGNPAAYQSDSPGALAGLRAALDTADADIRDAELGKKLSVFGTGLELVYMSADERPSPQIALLDPREAFVAYDDTAAMKPLFGVHYSARIGADGSAGAVDITVYTHDRVQHCRAAEAGGTPVPVSEEAHWFGGIPLLEYWNNEEGMGDFEHVVNIIDAYNVLQSDRVNDKERFVSAILVMEGATFEDEDEARAALRDGSINTPEGSRLYYLTKILNEAETEVLKKSLAADIHKFSQTPDFTDENFSGNTSGVAMKFKILSLEYLAKVKERFLVEGLKARLRLFAHVLAVQGKAPVDVDKISVVLNRALPINELENAQTVATYAASGTVSRETLLTQVAFVKDKAAEAACLRAEQAAKNAADAAAFGHADDVDDVRL